MIYGITIILNDCNFNATNLDNRIKERYSYEEFYTQKKAALKQYKHQENRVINQKGISYGKSELKGCCRLYKANITNGVISNHGIIIKEHKI